MMDFDPEIDFGEDSDDFHRTSKAKKNTKKNRFKANG